MTRIIRALIPKSLLFLLLSLVTVFEILVFINYVWTPKCGFI